MFVVAAPSHNSFPPGYGEGVRSGHLLIPGGKQLKDVTILPQEDWNRIQYNLHKDKFELEKRKKEAEEKEQIFQASLNKHSKWANTIGVSLDYLSECSRPHCFKLTC